MKNKKEIINSRRAELVSASGRYNNNKPLKQVQGDNMRGFTLIELLVVVLIISILTTVAVSQYQKAVMKNQIMLQLPFAQALINAQEIYYLANGEYGQQKNLDIDVPGNCQFVNGAEIICGTDWLFDNETSRRKPTGKLKVSYCPQNNSRGSSSCYMTWEFQLNFYYQHPQKAEMAGQFECLANDTSLCDTFNTLFQ